MWQKVLGHLASIVDLVPNCRLLMRPLQLHSFDFFTPLSDSQSKLIPLTQEIKVLCAAWASPVRLLEGNLSPPVRLGRNSPASPDFRHLVQGGVLGPYQLSRTQGSVSGPQVSRSSCQVVLSTSHGYPCPARKLRVPGAKNYCSIPKNKDLQRAYNYEWRKHSAPYDAKTKCWVFVFSVGNEWRKHSAPYDAKINVGCLRLRSEINHGNIWLHMTLK